MCTTQAPRGQCLQDVWVSWSGTFRIENTIPRENIFMFCTLQTRGIKTIKRAPLAGTRPALEEQSPANRQSSPSSASALHVRADIPAVLSRVVGFMTLTLVNVQGCGRSEHQPNEAFDWRPLSLTVAQASFLLWIGGVALEEPLFVGTMGEGSGGGSFGPEDAESLGVYN